MPSNKTFSIAFYRDGLYYQENGSVNNFFRSVWKPSPPTTAFTDKATFIIDSRTIRNGVLIPGVSKMEKHSLDGVKDLWVFV
ncbi:MAG: hypothetical protein LBR07_08400, partial [Puniceicoccales bacterium]|nr:hypothetical protein [Puniceicoccales bacterium]